MFSPTFKIQESKAPLFFGLSAIWLRYGRFLITISESILAGSIANSFDRGLYKYWALLTKSKTNSIFQVSMAIHNRKFGHIAPLQN